MGRRRRDERGQMTIMIVGFALVLAMVGFGLAIALFGLAFHRQSSLAKQWPVTTLN